MKAIVARSLGGPQSLSIEDWQPQAPGPGEVRIRVHSAGVSFVDPLILAGKYQLKPDLPFIPGNEFSGEVLEVGEGVSRFTVGSRVCGGTFGGAFAEQITQHEDRLMACSGTSMEQAAVLRASFLTAWIGLVERAAIKPGETLLVIGAGGAVGLACCQLGRHLGATVIASASSAEKRALALRNGAHHAIDSRDDAWRSRLALLTDENGVDVVADTVGGELSIAALRSLAWSGRHLVIGFASGKIPDLPANLALLKGAAILGVDARQFGIHHPEAALSGRKKIACLHEAGVLSPPIAEIFPMERVAEAMHMAASGAALGRVVLRMT